MYCTFTYVCSKYVYSCIYIYMNIYISVYLYICIYACLFVQPSNCCLKPSNCSGKQLGQLESGDELKKTSQRESLQVEGNLCIMKPN